LLAGSVSRGQFITFEGGEGAGKTTQIGRLADYLRQSGMTVLTTREPGGSPGAEAIRRLLLQENHDGFDALSEVLLHYAARRDHLRKCVLPSLDRGEWVLCDRFADSTMAYQGAGMGVPRDSIAAIHAESVGGFEPRLTFILDLPVEIGMERARARAENPDRYERMDLDFHRRVREGFLGIATAAPKRCVVVDATRGVDEIAADVSAAVRSRLSSCFAPQG
jgi:dTMP kinase